MRALQHANEIRSGRARLKRELALARVQIEEIIARPPESAKTAKVYDLLLALPKIGPAKATRCLTHCRIAPSIAAVEMHQALVKGAIIRVASQAAAL